MSPRSLRSAALAVTVTLGFFPGVDAAEYSSVNPAASTLSFTFNQMGSRVYGTFGKFVGTLEFDTAHPEAARARLTIDLDSIDAGSEDANTELQKPAWFDTTAYPVAIFESTRIKDMGNNRYRITGNLTLKGVTREVTFLKQGGGMEAASPQGVDGKGAIGILIYSPFNWTARL